MGAYRAGDPVHVAGFGKGLVREVRNNGRYLVELKGRAIEVAAADLTPLEALPARRASATPSPAAERDPGGPVITIDLHGHTVDEALELLERALSDALLAGARELRVIHGRSGGRIKAAVHRRLGQLPSVLAFRVDSTNRGVTTVAL